MTEQPEAPRETEPELPNIVIKFPPLPAGAEGPPCIWCNAPTKRTGACFTCIACGSTTSC